MCQEVQQTNAARVVSLVFFVQQLFTLGVSESIAHDQRAAEPALSLPCGWAWLGGGGLRGPWRPPPSSVEIVARDVASQEARRSWEDPESRLDIHSRSEQARGKGALATVGDGALVDLYRRVGLLQHPPACQSHRTDTAHARGRPVSRNVGGVIGCRPALSALAVR